LRIAVALTLILVAAVAAALGVGWRLGERRRTLAVPVAPPSEEMPENAPIDRPPALGAHTAARVPVPPASETLAAPVPDRASDEPTMPDLRLSPSQAAKARAAAAIKELERSGSPSAALSAAALKAVENLKRLPDLANAEFGEFRCFGDGCAVTVTSRDASAAVVNGESIIRSQDFFSWPGPKFRSGPIDTPAGQVQTVVILYRTP
jgi:hypothetical protein